jgi:SOS-response transcriptional repressor LexA
MKMLKERLNEELVAKGWNASKLARLSGVPQPTLQRIMSGAVTDLRRENVIKLALGLGISESELRFGRNNTDVAIEQALINEAPLLTWEQATDWKNELFNLNFKQGETMVKVINYTEGMFALKVRCDTMQPEFIKDDILVIDPNTEAVDGDYIIAQVNGQATFKKLINDAGIWYLKSLNSIYPIISLGEGEIIGVVKEKIKIY